MKQYTLGSCIRSLRMHNQMTQTQLAEKLGVTDKAVSKWERGLSYPDIALFPRLADILGATVNDLLRECRDDCHPSKLLQTFEVSRDIRMPLHIMLGFVEIARQNHSDPEMTLRYLEGIKVSGEYLMSLLNSILQESCCCGSQSECCENIQFGAEQLEAYLHERMSPGADHREDFDFSGKRILIVDDMAINREIAVQVLRQTGAETETAEDGLICCRKLEAMPDGYYDLILMDIMMPNMDGLEATKRIRALPDERKAAIPIIAMTTNVSEKDRKYAFEAGMNDFTEKPIFVDRLFSVMSRCLAKEKD